MRLITKVSSLAYDRGLTIAQLSEKAGLKRTTIYDWTRHPNPRIGNLMKVAAALEVTLDELMEGVELPEPSMEET